MVRGLKRVVVGLGGCLLLLSAFEEVSVQSYRWPEVTHLPLATGVHTLDRPIHFPVSDALQGEVGFSEGNHSYYTLNLSHQGRRVLQWWGTPSFMSGPVVWMEPGPDFPRVLTYQPLILWDRFDTPFGTNGSGFYLWTYDGSVYKERKIMSHWLNLWIRSPIPFQD